MRNMLALVGAAVVAFGGVGWYLDWFKIHSTPAPSGHRSVNIDIDTVKIGEDLHRGTVKVQEVLDKKKDGETKTASPGKTDGKAPSLGIGKPFLDEGEEAEENPFDFRKPR